MNRHEKFRDCYPSTQGPRPWVLLSWRVEEGEEVPTWILVFSSLLAQPGRHFSLIAWRSELRTGDPFRDIVCTKESVYRSLFLLVRS